MKKKKRVWGIYVRTVDGQGTTEVKDGITTYIPPKTKMKLLDVTSDFEKAWSMAAEFKKKFGGLPEDYQVKEICVAQ